jgi:hypothetical protein
VGLPRHILNPRTPTAQPRRIHADCDFDFDFDYDYDYDYDYD